MNVSDWYRYQYRSIGRWKVAVVGALCANVESGRKENVKCESITRVLLLSKVELREIDKDSISIRSTLYIRRQRLPEWNW
jgi:hypothetical protein